MTDTGGNREAPFGAVRGGGHLRGVPEEQDPTPNADAVAAWIPEEGPISFGVAGALVADVWLAEHWTAIRNAAQDQRAASEEIRGLASQDGTELDPLIRDREPVGQADAMSGPEALTSSPLATTAERLAPALISDLHPM